MAGQSCQNQHVPNGDAEDTIARLWGCPRDSSVYDSPSEHSGSPSEHSGQESDFLQPIDPESANPKMFYTSTDQLSKIQPKIIPNSEDDVFGGGDRAVKEETSPVAKGFSLNPPPQLDSHWYRVKENEPIPSPTTEDLSWRKHIAHRSKILDQKRRREAQRRLRRREAKQRFRIRFSRGTAQAAVRVNNCKGRLAAKLDVRPERNSWDDSEPWDETTLTTPEIADPFANLHLFAAGNTEDKPQTLPRNLIRRNYGVLDLVDEYRKYASIKEAEEEKSRDESGWFSGLCPMSI